MSRTRRAPLAPLLEDPQFETAEQLLETPTETAELDPDTLSTSPLAPEEPTVLPPGLPMALPLPSPTCKPCCGLDLLVTIPAGLLAPSQDGFGNRQRHVDVKLGTSEADFISRLRRGLNEQSTRLRSGRHVESANDAVRWLLEQCVMATNAGQS